jgi:hypothetical protein
MRACTESICLWIETGRHAVVDAIMNLSVLQNAGNFLTYLEPVSFSRRTLLRSSVPTVQKDE